MKLFDLFVACHREEDGTTVLDSVQESPQFENKTSELMDTLPSLLFNDREVAPEYECCHYFVLTTADGARFYGCAVLYEKNSKLSCRALVSALPFYQTMKNVLTLVDDESDLSYLTKIPMPPPGVTTVTFYIGHQSFCVSRPPPNQLPLIDLPFWLPFALFSPDDLVTIFTTILVEKRIVFKSKYPTAIAPFIESLVALTYPLECFHTYIPCLLSNMKELLDSPLPYIIGVEAGKFDLDELDSNVLIVDIDNGRVSCSDMPPEIPKKPQGKLLSALKEICKKFSSAHREFFLKSPGAIKEPLPEITSFDFSVPEGSINANLVNGLCPAMVNNDKPDLFQLYEDVRAAFLRFLVVTLMNDPEISGKNYDISSPFNQEFLNTRTYQNFSERAKAFNLKKKVENLDDAKILFFKETVAAKINRSALTRKKAPTPFLWTEYWHIQRMFRFRSDYPNCIDFVTARNGLNSSADYTTRLAYAADATISSPSTWMKPFPEQKELDKQLVDKKAGLVIQKAFKMFMARQKYLKMKKAGAVVNNFSRMAVAKCHYEQKMKPAAVKIHSTARMYLAKMEYKKMRAAAIKMESAVRMYQAKKKFQEMREAAIKIESAVRMYQAKKKFQEMREAAIKMESTVRMYLAKKHFMEMKEAAVTIESAIRMYFAVRQFKIMKKAAVTINSFARMVIARKHYLEMEKTHPEEELLSEYSEEESEEESSYEEEESKSESTKEAPKEKTPEPSEKEEEEEEEEEEEPITVPLCIELFAKIWKSKQAEKPFNWQSPAILAITPEATAAHKLQRELARSDVRMVDRAHAVVDKNVSILEAGSDPEKNQHKNLYKLISVLQKKRMGRKPFDKIFDRFEIPVKGKKRKEQLLTKIEGLLSTEATASNWCDILFAAKVILVAEGSMEMSEIQ